VERQAEMVLRRDGQGDGPTPDDVVTLFLRVRVALSDESAQPWCLALWQVRCAADL
jgi:hypothetical protein